MTSETKTVCVPVEIKRYRVLYSDGVTVDYLAVADHSGVRALMVEEHFGKKPDKLDRIEGVALIGVEYVHVPDEKHVER